MTTLSKNDSEIEEFERLLKTVGHASRTHFFEQCWDAYFTQVKAGHKLVFPLQFATIVSNLEKQKAVPTKAVKKRPKKKLG